MVNPVAEDNDWQFERRILAETFREFMRARDEIQPGPGAAEPLSQTRGIDARAIPFEQNGLEVHDVRQGICRSVQGRCSLTPTTDES